MEEKPIKLYKLAQVCQMLNITYPTVLNYIRTGKLKGIKMGGQWRIRHQDLKRFIEEGNEDNPTFDMEDVDIEDSND